MSLLKNFGDFFEPLMKHPITVLRRSAIVWLIMPLVIFVFYSFWLIIFGINEEGITKLILLAVDAGLEWWISILLDLKKALVEYLFSIILVLGYYHFN